MSFSARLTGHINSPNLYLTARASVLVYAFPIRNPSSLMTVLGKLRLRTVNVLTLLGVAGVSFALGVWWHARQSAGSAAPGVPAAAPSTAQPAGAGDATEDPPIETVSIRAEFNPQSALLLGVNELVRYHQAVFKDVVRTAHARIPIIGLVDDDGEIELGRDLLTEAGLPLTAVHFVKHPLDSMWLRDFGPLFARWSDGRVEVIDALYRGGDENNKRARDDVFATYVGSLLALKVRQMPLVIEGGNLLANGDGLMVTSTRVLNRPENGHLSREQIGAMLKNYLGCRLWVYLREMEGEPTGHIDFCLTFLRRNLVVVGAYDPAYDPVNAAILDEMANTLRGLQTSMGPMKVERIYMPPRTPAGDWRSYCNVLMCNGVILVPSYSDVDRALEQKAHATFARLMPSQEVVPINCDTLVKKRGVLHCVGITLPGYVNVRPLLRAALE